MINTIICDGKIKPYIPFHNAPGISYFMFADDLIIFINGSNHSINNLMKVLHDYGHVSGQKINVQKSNILDGLIGLLSLLLGLPSLSYFVPKLILFK